MKKHLLIFCAVFLALIICINYAVNASKAAIYSPNNYWEIEGDRELFSNVKINYCVSGGKESNYMEVWDSIDEREDYITFPFGDEVIVTPYFYVCTRDDNNNPIWEGTLRDYNCNLEISNDVIGDRCYVIVSYDAPSEYSDKSFTDIYLVSENAKTILDEPKLVMHFDFYATLQQFEIDYPDDPPGYYTYGISVNESLWNKHNMIHFKDDKFYLLIPMYASEDKADYYQKLELLVYEESQKQPMAKAIIYNDLFSLEMDGSAKYSDNDYNYTAFNYSFEL